MLGIVTWACDAKPTETSRIGVFADTGSSLVELSSYAKQTLPPAYYNPPDLGQVPEAARVNSFYVNMPDVTITESKVVWLVTVIDVTTLEILGTQIEKNSGRVYKVSSAALQSKRCGISGLRVIMPRINF